MKYMKKNSSYSWTDYKTNTELLNELKITSVIAKVTSIQYPVQKLAQAFTAGVMYKIAIRV